MRSSDIFASALFAGALARPHVYEREDKRNLVILTEYEIVTLVVTITAVSEPAASTSSAISVTTTLSSKAESSTPSSAPASTPATKPSSEAAPAPPSSSSAPSVSKPDEFKAQPMTTTLPSSTSKPEPEPSSSFVAPASTSTSPTPQPSAPMNHHVQGPEVAYLSAGPDYEAALLYHHNAVRANHDAAPLVWDHACEVNARIAAERCIWEHYIPEGAGQGQNLFAVSGDLFNATGGVRENWYNGELPKMMPFFGQKDVPDDIFHEVGHLTQMVWKETTKVGCVSYDCGDKMIVEGKKSSINKYTVCNYAPAGNVGGAFAENVDSPIAISNLGGWSD